MQKAAPSGITLSGLKIKADGKIPLILGPGVSDVTLQNSSISGTSQSVAIYLDAESANNVIANNIFDLKADRELIAVDGSKGNQITGNTFTKLPWGGVYVYRNCGERGVVRHQKPTNNQITNNTFNLNTLKSYWEKNPKNGRQLEYRYAIWLGSRQGSRAPAYCDEDKGYPFGSSIDNRDFADDNIISGNRRIGSSQGYLLKLNEDLGIGGYNKFIKNDGRNNSISGNSSLNDRNRRVRTADPVRTIESGSPLGSTAAPAAMPALTPAGDFGRPCSCTPTAGLGLGLDEPPMAAIF